VLVIFVLLFLMSSNHGKSRQWNPFERMIVEITAPFQKIFHSSLDATRAVWIKYFYLINARKENILLKDTIYSLKVENYRYKELLSTYQRLQKLLQFSAPTDQPVLAAQITGKDPSGLYQSVIINRGKKSGLSINMPVINSDGVVGRIVSVSDNYSKVLLIIDQNSAVDCIIERSRSDGIVKGLSSQTCYMDYVLKTSDINVDDVLVTSGLGGVFPKGLPVGKVIEIKEPTGDFFMDIKIKPYVDFSKLEEVLVILSEDPLADQ
jgi:rod shape-determining protein MreC